MHELAGIDTEHSGEAVSTRLLHGKPKSGPPHDIGPGARYLVYCWRSTFHVPCTDGVVRCQSSTPAPAPTCMDRCRSCGAECSEVR